MIYWLLIDLEVEDFISTFLIDT